ncbi:MAG: LytR C-terminal domain-containing protein [Actinobacteria bacterium]|nr:LytR C-terminal domain-containing protein [Actinomycetota bacterium]
MPETLRSAGYRQWRRALERARRRRRRRRLAAFLGVVVLLGAGLYLGLGARGERANGGRSSPTTTGQLAAGPVEAGLVRVNDAGGERVIVLVAPRSTPPLVLALPPDTLIQGSSGFGRLDKVLAENTAAAAAGIEALTGARPAAVARVLWADLRAAAAEGSAETWPARLPDDRVEAGRVAARAVAALAAGAQKGKALDALPVEGDSEALRTVLRQPAVGTGVVGVLPGRLVEGQGFTYYEPDPTKVEELLGGAPPARAVSVEVQNGSGVVGIAQKVAQTLEPLGYTFLPPKNADAFPDVESTRIFAAADVLAEADRIRGLLGKGTVVKQESLPAHRIIVVVGKDLTLADLTRPGG